MKSLLESQAKELARKLKTIPGIKTKTKFAPWDSATGGFGTTLASCTKNVAIEVYLDRAAGEDRPRFWVGFHAKSRAALDHLIARLPETDRPTTRLEAHHFTKTSKNGYWRYSRARQKELVWPYAECTPTGEFFYGLYDWGGHATETSLQLDIHRSYSFIKNTVENTAEDTEDNKPRPPRLADVVRRLAVEKAAMDAAIEHLKANGFTVTDRTGDNCGWDLDARNLASELKVEVKGLSGNGATVEVSPNEFEAMSDPEYRICIVTNALSDERRKLQLFEVVNSEWVSAGAMLNVEQRIGARITIAKR